MKAYERAPTNERRAASRRGKQASSRMFWVGKARVTAAEIGAWQLGPDLVDALIAEDSGSSRQRAQ
jgi:hypothetical protein